MISGGERQLVLLARALAQEPQFIVLDEPTASLDFGNQGKVMREIRALAAAGHGVLFTTHDPNHAMRAADRAYLLRDGRPDRRRCDRRGAQPRAAGSALRRAGRDDHRYGGPDRVSARLNKGIGMAKIKVMSAGAVEGPVSELAPEFTRASGHEVELHFNTVGAHRERFVQGEKTDVIILSFPAIEALEKEGRFVAGSRADLGRASCGVAVRDGMMMPNISTVEGFKRMLKFAVSIAANDPAHGGSSGIYLADLLKRMGLYDEVKPEAEAVQDRPRLRSGPGSRRGRNRHHLHQRIHRGPRHARGRHVSQGDRICERLRRRDPQGRCGRAGPGVPVIPDQPHVEGVLQVVRVGVGRSPG